eukprot:9183551-Pyramimonas_sp.AAC.1
MAWESGPRAMVAQRRRISGGVYIYIYIDMGPREAMPPKRAAPKSAAEKAAAKAKKKVARAVSKDHENDLQRMRTAAPDASRV